jgi:hypothetical protein
VVQLVDLFDLLGMPISMDDALLLMRKINGGAVGCFVWVVNGKARVCAIASFVCQGGPWVHKV